ncbi:MAG TPA: N-acetylglucosamine-6-phosphate deacetylase [Candidatus Caenarcaniphilales bacterium]
MSQLTADSCSGLSNLCITQARLPGYQGLQRLWLDHQGQVQAIQSMEAYPFGEPGQILDVAGDWLSLGGVDLQINGALGLAFTDLAPEHEEMLLKICQFLWEQGIDGFLPTLVTTSVAKIQQALATLKKFSHPAAQPMAQNLGAHLEGPFLNPQKRGAHPLQYLLPLTVEQVNQVLADYAPQVKLITLAPELDSTGAAIAQLRSQGIIISLGHSLATAAQAQQAFAQGASLVTHAFNAMPGLHHREPGLLGAAILNPKVWCGLIADGQHINPMMIDLLLRATGNQGGIFLVSDALAPLGLPDGIYPWDARQIEVKNGTAQLSDGTLAGTTVSLLTGVQNLVRWGVCSVETAIALATEAPRKALGMAGLAPGQPARHLLRWHQDSTGELYWQRF